MIKWMIYSVKCPHCCNTYHGDDARKMLKEHSCPVCNATTCGKCTHTAPPLVENTSTGTRECCEFCKGTLRVLND